MVSGMGKHFRISLYACALLLAAAVHAVDGGSPAFGGAVRINAGIYDNHPKLYLDGNGKPGGIFVDIMNAIAREEGWSVNYVFDEWADNLARLEKGEIDILLDVSYSEERAAKFLFNHVPIIDSWLQVFCRNCAGVSSISDLDGKSIAVLKGGVQERFLASELKRQFNIHYSVLTFPDYAGTVNALNSGKADVIVASRFFFHSKLRDDDIKPTAIVFRPDAVHFAFRRNIDPGIVKAVDRHIAGMKNEPGSVYYRSLDRQLGLRPRVVLPRYVKWIFGAVTAFLALALVVSYLLRVQVRRRTAELRRANEELKAAMEDAVNRERLHVMGQMAGGIAHDFNNILVPVSGFLDMLLGDPASLEDRERVRKILSSMKEAVSDGAEIVMRMRDFYRARESRKNFEPVDLNALADDVLLLTKPKWKRPGGSAVITVKKIFAPGCVLLVDRAEFREMLINLIFNAVDAMPGGGTLSLATEAAADAVRVIVKDTGTGMTDEVRERCTSPFYSTKGDKGTGLGLAMVQETVLRHGGSLVIRSAPGEGSAFIISLPRNVNGGDGVSG